MAKSFSDAKGRSWIVDVNVSSIKRVEALTGKNILRSIDEDGKFIVEISTDPILLCNVLFALLQPEAEKRQVSDVDFGEALAGDAISAATGALIQGIVDFFPQPRRGLLQKAWDKAMALEARAWKLVEEKMDASLLAAEKTQNERSNSSTNAPAPSASIQADSPSGS